MIGYDEENYTNININELLSNEKRLISFVGTSKSGTSFIINNIAEILSNRGVKVAIIDTTQNKNSYYIYTKNEEALRCIANESIQSLYNGEANGIQVNENLSVYTSVVKKMDCLDEVEKILETLIENYSIILVDADFETPEKYFYYSNEVYLIQTMDVLTVQPLTEFLSRLKNRNFLDENKLRIIINKYLEVESITPTEIVGGMAFYNEPTMAYMQQLFNKDFAKYIVVPFNEDSYRNYLNGLAKCDISISDISNNILQVLRKISTDIYPYSLKNTEN